MKVMRMFEKEVKKFKIGDQIALGRYTATAMAQDETGTTFCLDQIYGEKPMKCDDLKRFKTLFDSKMFDEIRDMMEPFVSVDKDSGERVGSLLRFPTAEELWGKRIGSCILPTTIEGADKRWEAMKDARNRIGFTVTGTIRPYWTESMIGSDDEINGYVTVCYDGGSGATDMKDGDNYVYFRPVFKLRG